MKTLLISALVCLATMTTACSDGVNPESAKAATEQIVNESPATVYADLDKALTDLETASKDANGAISDTREPVAFAFDREQGRRLRFEAKSGFRTNVIHIFIDPGAAPDQTKLRVYFDPKWIEEMGASEDLRIALATAFSKIRNDLKAGGVVATLFHFRPSPRGERGFAECSPENCG